jgi:hypothetical protein
MSLFIQSANALVNRVAQWVGAIPQPTGITVSSYDSVNQVLTVGADPTSIIFPGDYIAPRLNNGMTIVLSVTSSTITVVDPDGYWTGVSTGTNILALPTAQTSEIYGCIQACELRMRTLELPSLRTNPYDPSTPTVLTTDQNGMAPIPADMNWPILFFQETPNPNVQPGTPAATMGPWIIYDRVGDREIIRRRMIDQLYVRPFGVPRVIRASFSEVGPNYVFTPNPGANVAIKAYYQRTFPFLFSPTSDSLNPLVMNNAVLSSFPEGYLYGTLWAYYDKNKNTEEAQKWDARLESSYGNIEDQNFKDKWRGGDTHLTSEYQPRTYRYNFK